MKIPVFFGSCTAMVTPFHKSGIDFEMLKKQIDFQIRSGTAAILVAGTTGESPTLDDAEFEHLTECCIRNTNGRTKVIVGIGGNNTWRCAEKAAFAERAGADAVLMSTPYYNKGTQNGLIEHFCTVADRTALPLILYNITGRTGIGIAPETYLALAGHPNINGVKEASGDFSLIGRIVAECGDNLNLWCGNDDQTLPMMALGAVGVISVASNIIPSEIASLCTLCLEKRFEEAGTVLRKYERLFQLLFRETNPIPVKAAMKLLGTDAGILRLPLTPMTEQNLAALKEGMEELKLLHA